MGLIYFTIASNDHLYKAIAVLQSVRGYEPSAQTFLLAINHNKIKIDGITMLSLDELCRQDERAVAIIAKYGRDSDETRWSLKAV